MLPQEKILPNKIALRAAETPDRPYLLTLDDQIFSYKDVHEHSLRWAAAFKEAGIAPEQQVAFLLGNRPESLFGWLGTSWLRARQVPINIAYRGTILQHVLVSSEARLLIIGKEFLDRLELVDLNQTLVKEIIVADAEPADLPPMAVPVRTLSAFLKNAEPTPCEPPRPFDVASITYTSGTTGPSKGVIVYWAHMYTMMSANRPEELSSDNRWYCTMPMFHVGGQSPFYQAALSGGSVLLRSGFSASAFMSDVKRYGCTFSGVVGTMANFLLAQPPDPSDRDIPLRYVHMTPVLANVDAFKERFGVVVAASHGMTEIATCIASGGFNRNNTNHRSCGTLRAGFEARLVDEHDEEVPVGKPGELIVRADEPWTLNGGYINMPEATNRAWRNGWFHTGDVLSRDSEGNYYFVDRVKDAIRRRGENISSKEVESEIDAFPGVVVSAVVGVPAEHSEDEVKAYLIVEDETKFAPAALIEFLKPRLPSFMLPRFIEVAADLPRTPSGKVQKNLLKDRVHGSSCWDRGDSRPKR